jgi:quinolinate synthase
MSEEILEQIAKLRREKRALIIAHNYQSPAVQDLADFTGDSLELSRKAAETDARVIVFCGVHFMAETAKILNPDKTVILPDRDAGCSLEQSCPAPALQKYLEDHADRNYYVIAYINCSAGVKALSDVICTSGNAVRIVEQAPADRPILFVPDENLGAWVMENCDRKMDLWKGSCYVHVEFTRESIQKIKDDYPDAVTVAHPECTTAVRLLADEVCSTEKMVTFCQNAETRNIIVVTEGGMLHRLRKEAPDKNLIAGPTDSCACSDCKYMKMNTLEKLHACLENLEPRIEVLEDIRGRAEAAVVRMLEQSK